MATMIPPEISAASKAPHGEREIFQSLRRDCGASATWVVMHSLDIRWHICKLEGEADFLVLAPGLGVLVVEVKGCNVTRRNGMWTYHYESPKTGSEGPFAQARTAMYSLRNWLSRRRDLTERGLDSWNSWLWHSCVAFTSIDFRQPAGNTGDGLEWMPSEVISAANIARDGIPGSLARALKQRHTEVAAKQRDERDARLRGESTSTGWYDNERSRPSAQEVKALVELLRPDLCFAESGAARVRQIEDAIRDATEAQSEVALGLLDNDRVLIKGGAGTGKTFVAVRMARYLAAERLRVGFVCFNTLLADWLRHQLGHALGDVGYVGTLSKLMLDISGITIVPPGADARFWNEALPQQAADRLVNQDTPARFDVLFVDEAQDILKQPLLDVLDLLLVGGLKGGRWVFAGDFSGQAIYDVGASEPTLLSLLEGMGTAQATYTLRRNCRNARAIHGRIRALGFASDMEVSSLADAGEGAMKLHFVGGARDAFSGKLRDILIDLRSRFDPEDIVVLSALSDGAVAAGLLHDPSLRLRRLDGPAPAKGHIGYTTIHAFKGLDSKAVVVTDLPALVGVYEKLLYTGISRGRIEVHLLLEDGLRSEYRMRLTA